MIPRHCIYLALFVLAIIATAGCLGNSCASGSGRCIEPHLIYYAINNSHIGNEEINMSVHLPGREFYYVPLPHPGTSYHVIVQTTKYDNVIYGHYSYQTTSQYTDRFGVHNTTTIYKDVAMIGGDYYLGVSDNSHVIDSVVTIPAGAEDPKLIFFHSDFDSELYSDFDVSVTEVIP